MKKLLLFPFLFLLLSSVHAQFIDSDELLPLLAIAPGIEGDALIQIVGSKVDAPATVSFLSAYDIQHIAGIKYSSSKTGVDMNASNDTLVSMTLYHDNPLYGSYTNKLPKGIRFNMNSAEVAAKLGKGTIIYKNSGYCEYHFGRYVLTCWFEKEVLNSVTIALQ
jgi:hypothetical protein